MSSLRRFCDFLFDNKIKDITHSIAVMGLNYTFIEGTSKPIYINL